MVAQTSYGTGTFAPFLNSPETYLGGLEALSQGFEPLALPFRALTRSQLEVLGFLNRRTQACLDLPSRLATCRTPQDFLGESMNFWKTGFEQFAEASQRIVNAWGQGTGVADRVRDHDYMTVPSAEGVARQGDAIRLNTVRRRIA